MGGKRHIKRHASHVTRCAAIKKAGASSWRGQGSVCAGCYINAPGEEVVNVPATHCGVESFLQAALQRRKERQRHRELLRLLHVVRARAEPLKRNADLGVRVAGKLVVLGMIIARARHFRCAVHHPVDVALCVAGVELAAAGFGESWGTVPEQPITKLHRGRKGGGGEGSVLSGAGNGLRAIDGPVDVCLGLAGAEAAAAVVEALLLSRVAVLAGCGQLVAAPDLR
jgi:hypothetical protein